MKFHWKMRMRKRIGRFLVIFVTSDFAIEKDSPEICDG